MNFTRQQLLKIFDVAETRARRWQAIYDVREMSFIERLARRPLRGLLKLNRTEQRLIDKLEAIDKEKRIKASIVIYNYVARD